MNIKPTIGRRVWYWPSSFDKGRLQLKPDTIIQTGDPTQACDAGIAYVHSDTMINVTVADHNGNMHKRTSVPLLGFDDPKPQDNAYCTWMDYQVQQVKLAEVVKSKILEPVEESIEEFTSGEGASS
jgi:hypothetical protein